MGGSSGVPSWYGSLLQDDSMMIHRHAMRFVIRFSEKKDRDVYIYFGFSDDKNRFIIISKKV